MTTTSQFQQRPDYYMDEKECKESKEDDGIPTNPRYKHFVHNYFKIGDEEQFQIYRYAKPIDSRLPARDIDLNGNIFADLNLPIWEKNQNISSEATLDTFRYIFNKFKKGIFIKIVNNELKVFLPFSKVNFINEWSQNIRGDPKYLQYCPSQIRNDNRFDQEQKLIYGFLNYVSGLEKRPFNPRKTNSNLEEWVGNGCILRKEFPVHEGENNVSTIKNMFDELCASRQVPDIELFINRRDFPIITNDSTEAYNHLFNSSTLPLVSHNYEKYVPILSYSISNRNADCLYPTWDDWARVKNREDGVWFPPSCTGYNSQFNTPWEEKIPIAVFRGTTTGCGTTIETNPRLRVADISFRTKPDENGIPYIDAGVTKWNLRPRKLQYEQYLQTIEKDSFEFGLVPFKSPAEQSRHKYIIHIEGHVSAFRLSLELSMGSVILLVDSPWKIWFSDMLKPYVHYVPVNSSMDNLIDQIKWCRSNDDKCREIAMNALQFYNTYLGKKGILDYMQKLFVHLKKEMGETNYVQYPSRIQIRREYKSLTTENSYPETIKSIEDINTVPHMGRCYGLLKGIEYITNMFNKNFDRVQIKRELYENKDYFLVINLKELAQYNFVIKTTNEGSTPTQKELEFVHNAYIGKNVINKLLKHIPNFVYTFGLYRNQKKINLISEYINGGETLFDYLTGPEFNINEFMFILIQLCFALKVAQNRCGFVHYDLTPRHIFLERLRNPVSFDYLISYDRIYRVTTNIIPVINNYGKSHVIHNGYHYGLVNMFKSSISQDVFSLLIKSLDIILNRKLSQNEFNLIFRLSNFIRPFRNAKEIKNYVNRTKKYEERINIELDNGPMELISYIENNMNIRPMYQKVDTYMQFMNNGNPRQVFDYILSKTNQERLESYIDVIRRFKTSTLPQIENIFFQYYTAQRFQNSFESLRDNLITFGNVENINVENQLEIFKTLFSLIQRVYKTSIDSLKKEKVEFELNTENVKKIIRAPYTENTIQNKNKTMSLLSEYNIDNYKDFDLSEYRNMVEGVFCYEGKYIMSGEHRSFYLDNFRELLDTDPFIMMNNNGNIKTLIDIVNNNGYRN